MSPNAPVLSEGWHLGLTYMQGVGLRAAGPGEIEPGSPADFLFVDDVLGLCPDWRGSLARWWAHLNSGAHLIVWVKDCTKQEASGHRFTQDLIDHALDGVDGWEQLECDAVNGCIFAVWRKTAAGQKRAAWKRQAKHMLLIRSGAYGDLIMASSVLPLLRKQGWAVDLLTNEAGEEVMRHDPHLSRILLMRKGQLTDAQVPGFWAAHGGRYARVVNLAFSVEGELLKQPFRGDYYWSEEQRRASCNRSYLRRVHELSGVEAEFAPRFYATNTEKDFARRMRFQHGPFILWCLRGSAVHKWWPHAPQAVCQVLSHSSAKIILSGDEQAGELAEPILAAARDYFGSDDRIINLCGKHSMREIMALAQTAVLVVGPETGVLNAVSFEKVGKLVMLSHSTPQNLTDDWVNARALMPSAPCYPCHRLHYGHEFCPQDEKTGAALCAASLGAQDVARAVLDEYRKALNAPFDFLAREAA
ncbi:MAG TPA: glycosyltransferase family 9 protein [Alphaproteobacteria bacterium]|nr:glycosyltransferase family 9 protein [Alphaproteobacteria bacterium]